MIRACKVTLKFTTKRKRKAISALLQAYRAATNFYIKSIWKTRGRLDKSTYDRLPRTKTRLSARLQSAALKQALEIVITTLKCCKATKTWAKCPVFHGQAILDKKFVEIEVGRGSFDIIIRLSVLKKWYKIEIPTRATKVLRRWLAVPGAKLIQGCGLSEDGVILWVDVPDGELKKIENGRVLALDIGVNKMLVDSDGTEYGKGLKAILQKIRRKKFKSKARSRAFIERDQYINRIVKEIPWVMLSVIGVEGLKDVKKGKKKGRNKAFRKAMAPWTYRRVLNQIGLKAQENRRGEDFTCVGCGYKADADFVGARNVLARTLATIGSVESPVPT